MKNKEIIKLLNNTIAYMKLHAENDFKIKSLSNAIYNLERSSFKFETLSVDELEQIDRVGKSIAQAIDEINKNGCYSKLDALKAATPMGLKKLMKLRGLGAKKWKILWSEAGIDSAESLEKAIEEGLLKKLKGFGDKTIQKISELVVFAKETDGWIHFAEAEQLANKLKAQIDSSLEGVRIELAGKLRRKWDVIRQLEFVIGHNNFIQLDTLLSSLEGITKEKAKSGPFKWSGIANEEEPVDIVFYFSSLQKFTNTWFLKTASPAHLSHVFNGTSLNQIVASESFSSEEEIYSKLNLAYCEPEIREGSWELELTQTNSLPNLLEYEDLTGVLHNHSTYSDGENTLEEMVDQCKQMGFYYVGISDHSKAASFYAKGMFENTVRAQHKEIDILNKKHAPFKIYKGIEADILADGSLDYDIDTLASFDFVVASIHSGLSMNIAKATSRLLKAIANPYTTILGHMTGRLLLMRKGYPVDHKVIIDACAINGVIIEINAHPFRLDIDWRWVNYAIEKGVLLSVNPDAHSIEGFKDMYYGVCVGRKGGLTREKTFNAWKPEDVRAYFKARKELINK